MLLSLCWFHVCGTTPDIMAPAFVGCRLYMAVCEDREWIETNMVLVNVDRPLFLERVHLYRVQGRKPLAPTGRALVATCVRIFRWRDLVFW